jgi:hypothetical protein
MLDVSWPFPQIVLVESTVLVLTATTIYEFVNTETALQVLLTDLPAAGRWAWVTSGPFLYLTNGSCKVVYNQQDSSITVVTDVEYAKALTAELFNGQFFCGGVLLDYLAEIPDRLQINDYHEHNFEIPDYPLAHSENVLEPYTPIPLIISGSEAVSVGTVYSIAEGYPPYTWAISSGEIDSETGEILDLSGSYGSGIVTVTDAYGNTASKEVQFPLGQWVLVDSTTTSAYGACGGCGDTAYTCSTTPSGAEYRKYYYCLHDSADCLGGLGCTEDSAYIQNELVANPCTGEALSPTRKCVGDTDNRGRLWVLEKTETYAWECP